ncbi:MAG: OmpH family outer membrane protein [Bacteroidota bacterium]|nr:OmpH family outer membrane protein [Bacteroidota bacterium]MDP3144888.1 OmpH family outer membrane protein [Bacteroidota bacterium]
MNKIIIGVNALLVIAVGFLFYKLNTMSCSSSEKQEPVTESTTEVKTKPVQAVGNTPTGKIAFVNIDVLNDKSLEVIDLIAESKRKKTNIEASVENLSMQYQKKVEEFQMSQKAGIAPQSELEAKAREIQAIEKEAQNKQIQMDNLSMDIGEKNASFQKNVKDFLIKWNNGKYDYILSYSDAVPTMLLGNPTLEITDEVVEQFNAEYKSRKTKK